jgi:hypothetical protein
MKNNKMFFLVVNGIIAVLCLIGVYYTFGSMQVQLDEVTNQPITDTSAVGTAVSFSLGFAYGSLILIAAFTIWAIIDNPKRFIPSFIGLAVFMLIFFISYTAAPVETTGKLALIGTPTWIKWSGVGVIMTYILVGLAVVLLVSQMVRQLLGFLQK